MTAVLFTLYIHYCTAQGCETKPLSQWPTLEECLAQIEMYHAVVPGNYSMECKQ